MNGVPKTNEASRQNQRETNEAKLKCVETQSSLFTVNMNNQSVPKRLEKYIYTPRYESEIITRHL